MQKSRNGFTLIEILVVVSVIGLLSAFLTVTFTEARQQARDRVRMSTMEDMRVAIELYKAQNGQYPARGCGVTGSQWAGSESSYTGHPSVTPCPGAYIDGLAPDFIAVLPAEIGPEKVAKGFAYRVNASRTQYKLLSHHNVESLLVSGFDHGLARFPNITCMPTYPPAELDVYAIYSVGAECW